MIAAIRRIPFALTCALVLQAMRLVINLFALDVVRHPTIGFELVAIDLVGSALAAVGLVQLAARATVRAGAIVAAIGAVGGVAMVFVSSIMRPHADFEVIYFAQSAVIAIGFAVMIARQSWPLMLAMFVLVIAGAWLRFDAIGEVVYGLGFILAEVAIAAGVSPEPAPRAPDPIRTVAVASLVLFAISLFVPAVVIKDFSFDAEKPVRVLGITCLTYGWLLWLGWLANPLLLVGAIVYALRWPRAAFACGCLAIVSAGIAPFLLFRDDSLGMQTLQIGYWLWVASIVTFIIAAYARARPRAPRFPGAL
jgi:hypothetical protein